MEENLIIIPVPKTIKQGIGNYKIPSHLTINCDDFDLKTTSNPGIIKLLNKIFINYEFSDKLDADVIINKKTLKEEEYLLKVTKNQIVIKSNSEVGIFYSLQTLRQIIKDGQIPALEICDAPDLKIRGVMIDISRSKVPKLETLKEMIDLFAMLKYNHLELYVEGFSFEYSSFKRFLKDQNYLTLEEYLEIQDYATENYIDFVPNQNGFGHMGEWLKQDEFKHLAECEEGFTIWGSHRAPTTLNPLDQGSLHLVKTMYHDMLPYTKSRYFNMNFDEPYELGHGKSKEKLIKNPSMTIEDLYLDYLKLLVDEVNNYHKIPLVWGDVVIKNADVVSKMPKDLILVDWGYHKKYPFEQHSKMLKEISRMYLLASGTNTWACLCGRYDDMFFSIKNASVYAKTNNGLGTIVTDWGDVGHLQYWPFSYLGILWGSITSWGKEDEQLLMPALQRLVGLKNAQCLEKLSKYTNLEGEYRDYGSRLFSSIIWAEHSNQYNDRLSFFDERMKSNFIEESNLKKLNDLFDECENILGDTATDDLVGNEIETTIFLLRILLKINYKLQKNEVNYQEEIKQLEIYESKHKNLWCYRNKEAGLKFSNQRIVWLKEILIQKNLKGEKK